MGSGLVYAVIVALWAGVLVPMWLRRHDAENESRSVDRFTSAMQVLGRRSRTTNQRTRLRAEPGAEIPAASFRKPTERPVDAASRVEVPVPARRRPVRLAVEDSASAAVLERDRRATERAMRRRNALLALSGVLVLSAVLMALGLVGAWLPIMALIAAGGYVGAMVRSGAQEQARREAERRVRARERQSASRTDRVASPARRPSTIPAPNRPAATTAESTDSGAAVVAEAEDQAMGWRRGTPVPLPSYATAPAATLSQREIDRGSPEGWGAREMLERAAAVRAGSDPVGIDAPPQVNEVWAQAVADQQDGRDVSATSDRDAIFDRTDFDDEIEGTA